MPRLEQLSPVMLEKKDGVSLNLLDVARLASTDESIVRSPELTSKEFQKAKELAKHLDSNELNASLAALKALSLDPDNALKVLKRTKTISDGDGYSLRLLTLKDAYGKEHLKNIDVVSRFSDEHHRIEAGTGKYSLWLDIGDGQLLSKPSLEKASKLVGLLNSNKLNAAIGRVSQLAAHPEEAMKIFTWAKTQENGQSLSLNLLTHKDEAGKIHLRQVDIVSPFNDDHHRIEMESGRYTRLKEVGERGSNKFLAPRAADAFQSAFYKAKKDGVEIEINSSWRSYRDQTRLYKNLVNISPVAWPGTSMHEVGRAVDIQNYGAALPYLAKTGWYWPNLPDDPWHFEYRR
jgi:ferritin